MMSTIVISQLNVAKTVVTLQRSGQQRHEGIVLWLGRRDGNHINIAEVYEPAHVAKADYFHIPSEGMKALQAELRTKRLMIAAQVHSHPMEAFHSKADDTWAVIRHVGAVSIVLPFFAGETNPDTFFEHAAVFQLSAANQWIQVPKYEKDNVCRISQ